MIEPANVRSEALRRLLKIEEGGAFIGLDDERGKSASDGGREARQALEYIAGVTRWRRYLDFVLAQFYRGEVDRLEPILRQILRIGLYDLLFLDSADYAAVNEAVDLAKKHVRKGAGGLVNGVLRNVLRQKHDLAEPKTGDEAEDMAIRHSHPTWIVRRWLKRYGAADTESLLKWNNERPEFGVRINELKIEAADFKSRLEADGVEWEEGRYLPYFLRLPTVQPLLRSKLLREGYCAVQDESAGLIVALLDPQPGEVIVDACAAPGGKALHAAQRMANKGEVLAVDVHEGRLSLVRRAASEQNAGIVATVAADFRSLGSEWKERADRVLVDAPCSGLGVLSKRADLRWRRQPEDLKELAVLQDEILESAARIVRPGGILVYGTCTLEPEENELRVEAFLKRHPEFALESPGSQIPEALVTDKGYYATFPPRDRVDGAFGARMSKE